MDIVVISSAFVKNEQPKKREAQVPAGSPHFVEKRRNRVDRRKSVRDGVVVSLSSRKERRIGPDRRRAATD
ncbi:hypothetical protein DSCA_31840 [Desulfosarcina alkanivorans]|jgi:hypothetical protein|uniref:Uncharacterized protein n=1 Tax=Desulfosarcina alkanivorans TaxID=571177 RepID=A0A5K7YSL7_9BACT|nr:hypothetical protein [Desulfosarcina alkanivorans]BBO69254.1 hypothetical protein DSCA_31840 [Desulfosarcina alkanivorans]